MGKGGRLNEGRARAGAGAGASLRRSGSLGKGSTATGSSRSSLGCRQRYGQGLAACVARLGDGCGRCLCLGGASPRGQGLSQGLSGGGSSRFLADLMEKIIFAERSGGGGLGLCAGSGLGARGGGGALGPGKGGLEPGGPPPGLGSGLGGSVSAGLGQRPTGPRGRVSCTRKEGREGEREVREV